MKIILLSILKERNELEIKGYKTSIKIPDSETFEGFGNIYIFKET